MSKHKYLIILLIGYIVVAILYAVYTPEWQAPDEPAHYNYIRQLASGDFPILQPGDYDQEYQSLVISSGFDERYQVESFEYQDYQPPLYYLVLTPVYLAFNGGVLPIRIASLLIGVGIISLAYFIVLTLFPGRIWLALFVGAFVAFLPQHTALLASINNDSLAELIIAAILLLTISLFISGRDTDWDSQKSRLFILGIMIGLGFVTKVSTYIMAPLVGISLLWLYWKRWQDLLRGVLLVFGPAMVIGLVWWIRNAVVYGHLDLLGTIMHNRVVVGQPLTSEWIAEKGLGQTLKAFAQTTFQSFWGQFGWMGVVMPSWVYQILLLFSAATAVGFLWGAYSYWRSGKEDANGFGGTNSSWKAPALFLFGTFLLSLLVYVTYNFTFVQHQGRYLFSALIPISIGVAFAWVSITRPVMDRWPALVYLLPLGLALALVALDLLALFRFIVPSLA